MAVKALWGLLCVDDTNLLFQIASTIGFKTRILYSIFSSSYRFLIINIIIQSKM